jgi:RNA polymerase sigma factor (sigma-70 family)
LRRRQVRERPALRVVSQDEPTPADQALLRDEHRAVLDALRSLPDRQRDVLALRYWGELSEAEIADALGIAPGTVKTHAKRALDALAHRLEDRR